MSERVYTVLHLFCGLGGGALGFQGARASWRGLDARFETVLGIDSDPAACRDFEALTGSPSLRSDLAKMTPRQLREAAGDRAPDVVFASSPCKGYSGLLPSARAATEKYQAMNRLVLQGVWLVMETWSRRPPRLILLENVPRITSRGADLLRQVEDLLSQFGYRSRRTTHDCGELGGLAQHRKRFLLLARHARRLPRLMYQPAKRRVRAIGEVLGELPLPGDPAGGPLHRLPRLQWRTWVRLALIPAGGDWRDLPDSVAISTESRPNLLGVMSWDGPAKTVTGSASVSGSNGACAVADPRKPFNNVWRVMRWDQSSGAVTAGGGPSSSGICVADPRLTHEPRRGTFRIVRWDEAAPTVVGAEGVGRSSAFADPRLNLATGRHENKMRVEAWGDPAHTVIGSDRVGSGAPSVADPRLGCNPRAGGYRVMPWDGPVGVVIGSADVHAGGFAVADPRLGCSLRRGAYRVMGWDEAAFSVTGSADVHQGFAAIADPRLPADDERPDPPPVIISEDGTWHRPLTTLELAALQGLPTTMSDGTPLRLLGRADRSWRERIGNAVPPPAAQAVAAQMLEALLLADDGVELRSGTGAVWVEPRELSDDV